MRSTPARASGILLHPVSLPDAGRPATAADGSHTPSVQAPGSGDFGASSYHFIDWLAGAGQRLWQVLPLGPVGSGNSPYMSPSAFALNPLLVDLQELVDRGWLAHDFVPPSEPPDSPTLAGSSEISSAAPLSFTPTAAIARRRSANGDPDRRIDYPAVTGFRMGCLREAARRYFKDDTPGDDFYRFCAQEATWLDDYALFMAIGAQHPEHLWHRWPAALAARDPDALAEARAGLHTEIDFWTFVQWTARRQWDRVKRYANERRIRIIGDLPIFVALHSADVWANPTLFDLDRQLQPRVVAGVPPDYFSATGQLWGNPLYRWERHAADGYAWWIRRVKAAMTSADIVRIDHFRGFAAYWEVAADAPNAIEGRWVRGPAESFFEAVRAALQEGAHTVGPGPFQDAGADSVRDPLVGDLPIIAEDLGVVTPDVIALREAAGLPGMRVLQFAFVDDARNPYLPHNYTRDTVAYTGTHDNDTTVGWFAQASPAERERAQIYLRTDGREIQWDLIHAASQSVAAMAIYPLQDVLGLDTEARMNRPGDAEGCWGWRFEWSQVQPWHGDRLRQISVAHGRD